LFCDSRRQTGESLLVFSLGLERFGGEFSVGLLQENLDTGFGFFELLLALAGKADAFFEEFHGVIERELRVFEFADDFLEAGKRAFEVGLLGRFWFFG
jgi:hypothetical protein